jgi:hypothetical protein
MKLTNVIKDVVGVTGRAIIEALISGERDPRQSRYRPGAEEERRSRRRLGRHVHRTPCLDVPTLP